MIRVARSAVATPSVLKGDESAGKKERSEAERFFKVKTNRVKKFPGGFKAYKKLEIKAALTKLFHGKCAYCENRYSVVHPVDIEHFRPKGAVMHAGALRKPGYYWLAAEWTNLLPSCIDCNRSRRHPSLSDDADLETSGKANWFPIANEDQRANYPPDETSERRLLLDPCRDRPEAHLTFHDDALVEGRSVKGKKSIEVYGLNRPVLVSERKAVRLRLVNQMHHTTGALHTAKARPTAVNKRALANELTFLFYFGRSSQVYANMVRQTSEPYVEIMARKLRDYFAGDVPARQTARETVDAFLKGQATVDLAEPVLTQNPLADLEAV